MQMMKKFEECAKKHNYKKVTLKTLNDKRKILNYLVNNDWNFIEIRNKEDVRKNEIITEKELI